MKKTIKLLDLDCGHCADKIQNAVKKIDGVTSVCSYFRKIKTQPLCCFAGAARVFNYSVS